MFHGFTRSSTNTQSWGEGSRGALNSSDDIRWSACPLKGLGGGPAHHKRPQVIPFSVGRIEVEGMIGHVPFKVLDHGPAPVVNAAARQVDESHLARNARGKAAGLDPLGMRLEPPPRILFEKLLAEPKLRRAGSVHSLLPRRPIVDRRDARIAFHAHVPDAGRAVGVARRRR